MRRQVKLMLAVVFQWGALLTIAAPSTLTDEPKVGRPVRIVTLSFAPGRSLDDVTALVDREAAAGVDLVVLPETWRGKHPEPMDGAARQALAGLARKHRTYVVNPIYRQQGDDVFNSAVLFDRKGDIVGIYDKVWLTPPEYRTEYLGRKYEGLPELRCGRQAAVFDTDFGKLGLAICFDVCFPELWQQLDDQGAELVVWPSAYPGGLSLQAQAMIHHYYIVAASYNNRPTNNCPVVDITGKLIEDPGIPTKKEGDVAIARFTLDLDRTLYTHDYSYLALARKLVAECPDDLELETYLPNEAWFILRAKRPGVSVRALAAERGLLDARDSLARARRDLDERRGRP